MPLPWLRVLDVVVGLTDLVGRRRSREEARQDSEQLVASGRTAAPSEARLAGTFVAALKEVFDRDSRRLELEREQLDAERQRVERAMQLELLRQAADREIGHLRMVAAVAVASEIGTLLFSSRLTGGPLLARVTLAGGWVLVLVGLASAFVGQSLVIKTLGQMDSR